MSQPSGPASPVEKDVLTAEQIAGMSVRELMDLNPNVLRRLLLRIPDI